MEAKGGPVAGVQDPFLCESSRESEAAGMKQLKHVKPWSGSMQAPDLETDFSSTVIEGYIGSYSESYDENIS
jgi:hypothetical protein